MNDFAKTLSDAEQQVGFQTRAKQEYLLSVRTEIASKVYAGLVSDEVAIKRSQKAQQYGEFDQPTEEEKRIRVDLPDMAMLSVEAANWLMVALGLIPPPDRGNENGSHR